MSDGERKIADQTGKFAQVVADGQKVPDLEWVAGRVLLSNRRLLLVSNDGKRSLPLSKVRSIKSRQNVNESLAKVDGYVSVQVGSDVLLVSPEDQETLETELFGAILDQAVVLVKHPAVKGGVVQDASWEKGRLKTDDNEVALALSSGQFVEIRIDDVGTVELAEAEVRGERRRTVEVEHTHEGAVVQTHVSGRGQTVAVLASLLRKGEAMNATDVELTQAEQEVLMALYSGVSPFQIPDFVGMDVDRVEEIYDQLVEAGILEEIRTRRDVSLKARGRHVASEAMGEE